MARYAIALLMVLLAVGASAQVLVRAKALPINAAGGGSLTVASTTITNFTTGGATITVVTPSTTAVQSTIVISEANENANDYMTGVTATGLTFTKQSQSAAGASSGSSEIWTAPMSAGGVFTINCAYSPSGRGSIVCYVVTGVETTPAGAHPTGSSAQSAVNNSITTTRASSLIFTAASDFAAVNGARTYRTPSGLTSTTEADYNNQAGGYTGVHFYGLATTAQAYAVGFTAPSDGANGWGSCSVEVRMP